LEERRERTKKGRGLGGKEKRAGGSRAKCPSSSPGSYAEQRQRWGLGRWRPAGLPVTAVDGERGKRKGATRGFFSHHHLGLGCAVQVNRGRRRTAGWGGTVECNGGGEMACGGAR
jgi:hypothetical protein